TVPRRVTRDGCGTDCARSGGLGLGLRSGDDVVAREGVPTHAGHGGEIILQTNIELANDDGCGYGKSTRLHSGDSTIGCVTAFGCNFAGLDAQVLEVASFHVNHTCRVQ